MPGEISRSYDPCPEEDDPDEMPIGECRWCKANLYSWENYDGLCEQCAIDATEGQEEGEEVMEDENACPVCGGSGGGTEPALMCRVCKGTGERKVPEYEEGE